MATHLEPLAIAVNATQSNHARLDIVLLTLGHLYHTFMDPKYEPDVRNAVLTSLERRWSQAIEQDLFILAVIFNPYVRRRCFNPLNPLFSEASLWNMVEECFTRLFQYQPDYYFTKAFTEYLHELGDFSDQRMNLARLKQLADAEVSHFISDLWCCSSNRSLDRALLLISLTSGENCTPANKTGGTG